MLHAYRGIDVLCRGSGAIEYDGKRHKRSTTSVAFLIVFVIQLPTWSHLDHNVAADGGMMAVTQFACVSARIEKAVGSIDIAHSRVLDKELLTAHQHLALADTLLLYQFVVQIDFVVITGFNISTLAIPVQFKARYTRFAKVWA